ncbi:BA3454 family stress response protein [Pradoshia sp.]
MMNVTVLVDFMGRNYTTNVLAQRGTDESTIIQMAYEQVRKQWTTAK